MSQAELKVGHLFVKGKKKDKKFVRKIYNDDREVGK